jgi:hypothetical protein
VISLAALSSLAIADGRILRVARISLIEGDVSYQRAGDAAHDWFDATINMPLNENDQVFTGLDGRAEIQLTGRNIVRLNHDTNLKITQFNTGTTQLALSVGTATFRIESLDRRQFDVVDARDAGSDDPIFFEVDTPTVAVTLLKEGAYRINVREDGTTEIIVRQGAAEVYNQEFGSISVKQGRRMVVDGREADSYQVARMEDKDEWDRWNDRRDEALYARNESHSRRYVPAGVPGVYELDHYGDWWYAPDYGYVWSPRAVAVGWAPYRQGYWHWYPAYGWTWISYEPWGWAPYHYGRWAYYRNRWCWLPHGGLGVGFSWGWSPALVTFFGFGGGYRSGYRDGFVDGYRRGYRDGAYDWVGWVPLGPGEHHYWSPPVNNNNSVANQGAQPRTLEALKNYGAPGGLTGIEGRHFINPRVAVNNPSPPPPAATGNTRTIPVPVQTDSLRPTQALAPRTIPVTSTPAARRIASPVVTRRAGSAESPSGTVRTVEQGVPALRGNSGGTGEGYRTPPRRELPGREINREAGPPANATSSGASSGQGPTERRVDPAARRPDFQPVERPPRPIYTPRRAATEEGGNNNSTGSTGNQTNSGGQGGHSGGGGNYERRESPRVVSPPRRESGPSPENRPVEVAPRRVEPPARSPEVAPRRVEPPARPPVERRDPPPQQSAPRRVETPPARSPDSAPRTERAPSPPSGRARVP